MQANEGKHRMQAYSTSILACPKTPCKSIKPKTPMGCGGYSRAGERAGGRAGGLADEWVDGRADGHTGSSEADKRAN